MPKHTFQPPKGTRDFYPEDLLRRRYITETWRAVSIRHGFEEIDAPTFEHAELYAVKSGEGILSELFQAFSGKKSADEKEEILSKQNHAPYALRPEFTPSLARMYAARAKQLPKPTRWFCIPNFFRAERPQRGRLREFFQWNCDVVGGENDDDRRRADIEVCAVQIDCFSGMGLGPSSIKLKLSNRNLIEEIALNSGLPADKVGDWFQYLDGSNKRPDKANEEFLIAAGIDPELPQRIDQAVEAYFAPGDGPDVRVRTVSDVFGMQSKTLHSHSKLYSNLRKIGLGQWCEFLDLSIVRGLAYYTGTVFEVIAEGERAVSGGGRYDNLIELFGGPPTPACGFGMGDVVLSNLLDDNDLFPSGPELMDAISRTTAQTSLRPEAFLIPLHESHRPLIAPLLARLRRGTESPQYNPADGDKPWSPKRYDPSAGGVRPLHARTSDKSTTNPGKLLKDAERQRAKLAIMIDGEDRIDIRHMDTGEDITPNLVPGGSKDHASFCNTPGTPNDIARAIVALLDH